MILVMDYILKFNLLIMKEKDLLKLGFIKEEVPIEESGDYPYFYFTWEIENGPCLISSEGTYSKDVNDEEQTFTVELFNENGHGYCKTIEEVEILQTILKRTK